VTATEFFALMWEFQCFFITLLIIDDLFDQHGRANCRQERAGQWFHFLTSLSKFN
jgi:hypothetical protein